MTLLTHWEGEPVEVWRTLWGVPRLEIHDLLGSTNDQAKSLSLAGSPPWSLILAEAQEQGRGRGGKSWFSPGGVGLWFSLLIPGAGVDWSALLPLRVGMAVARGCQGVLGAAGVDGSAVTLKWPNDLLVKGKKVGGVLCETGMGGQFVAGVGINVGVDEGGFPESLQRSAGSLQDPTGVPLPRGVLLGELLRELRRAGERTGEILGPEELVEFTTRDVLKGLRVDSEVAGVGIARGLSETGSLLLEVDSGGIVEVRAGSINVI
jgi:BirA family biotin operon repressor/biotin-[acetyl-CoA-carboxylase] ligase